jgi:hypothetical protein
VSARAAVEDVTVSVLGVVVSIFLVVVAGHLGGSQRVSLRAAGLSEDVELGDRGVLTNDGAAACIRDRERRRAVTGAVGGADGGEEPRVRRTAYG